MDPVDRLEAKWISWFAETWCCGIQGGYEDELECVIFKDAVVFSSLRFRTLHRSIEIAICHIEVGGHCVNVARLKTRCLYSVFKSVFLLVSIVWVMLLISAPSDSRSKHVKPLTGWQLSCKLF